ncbi:MAG: YdcF family protein [Betaproteobacteria bacterium]|nr:YdcF family protein [Betaproteobacteria bacterium]
MSWSWLLTNTIAAFLLPPLNLLIIGGIGFYLLLRKRPRPGKTLIALSLAGLWILSMPVVAKRYQESLYPPFKPAAAHEADAIVILGGGRNKDDLEYGGDTPSGATLERLRYGAYLSRRLNKPILVTGGKPTGGTTTEAGIMAQVLADEFRTPARWVEAAADNTFENASLSARMLRQDGITRIYLVSHAWHLARAIPQFERQGLRVIPAGINYMPRGDLTPLHFIPNAGALQDSAFATHEWIGLLWYRIRNLME